MSQQIDVLITIPLPTQEIEALKALSERLNILHMPAVEGEELPPELWESIEVLYTFRVLPEPDMAPNLRWLQYLLAGTDRLAQAPISQKENLILTNMSGANASQVAEHALTLMLAMGHQLPELFAHQQQSEWMPDRQQAFRPVELRDSTVGIVGYGSIGRQVARLVKAFGAQVLATKRDAMQIEDRGYTPEGLGDPEGEIFTRLYPPQALRTMFKECDFVVVTVPLTAETRGMIAAEQLAALKPTACLIDVSRGGVVDQQALTEALTAGTLAGAALDVFPEEPLPGESPLWTMPNVLITPHVAGLSTEYTQRATQLFTQNLKRYLAGEELFNQVDLERGY